MSTSSDTPGPQRPRVKVTRKRSWLAPDANSAWWSADETGATSDTSGQVVDQGSPQQQMSSAAPGGEPGQPRNRARRQPLQPVQTPLPPETFVTPGNRQVVQQSQQDDSWLALIHDFATEMFMPWVRGAGNQWSQLGRGTKQVALTLITVVLPLLLIVVGIAVVVVNLHSGSALQNPSASPTLKQGLSPARPTATLVPTATPTQTELDGVITIENLDGQNPFAGDVSITADNGHYYCRNAPEPNSTWHIVLAAGATTQVPCVIPLSAPSSLPPHTFTTVVTGADGQGRALVDNLTAFTGTAYYPTPPTGK